MTSRTRPQWSERLFFALSACLLLAYALIGFWRSYFSVGLLFAPLPTLLVSVHGALFVGWLFLLIAQTALIATRRTALHRRLGVVMAWWALAMIVVGPATVAMALRRPDSGIDATIFAGDLAATIAFAVLIGAGLWLRRRPAAHKRLMLLGSAVLIGPALARWPFAFMHAGPPIAITVLYLLPAVAMMAYDILTRRRPHPATLLGFILMIAEIASFVLIAPLPAWQHFAAFVRTV